MEPEHLCCKCGHMSTTAVTTHYMSVCPDCVRWIVKNHIADSLKSGEIDNTKFRLDINR